MQIINFNTLKLLIDSKIEIIISKNYLINKYLLNVNNLKIYIDCLKLLFNQTHVPNFVDNSVIFQRFNDDSMNFKKTESGINHKS